MRPKKQLSISFILIFFTLVFSACATILGQKNTLVFTNDREAKAEVYIDGEKIGEAPGKIKVESAKIQHGSNLTIKAKGYADTNFLVIRKQHGIYTVADLLLGGIPLLVDYTNGNIYQPSQRKFHYVLQENK